MRRKGWSLPDRLVPPYEPPVPEWVLVELDGPQLIVARRSEHLALGLTAGIIDEHERWLFAPTTNLELEALCRGALTMRGAFEKASLDVFDFQDGKPKRYWRTSIDAIGWGPLPARGANLPPQASAATLEHYLKKPATADLRGFVCAGAPVQGTTIALGALSGIAAAIQDLWKELGDQFLDNSTAEDTTLRMSGAAPGSFGIVLAHTDTVAFRTLSTRYRDLVQTVATSAHLIKIPPRLARSYEAYLKALDSFDAEVYAQFGEQQTYLSAAHARHLLPMLSAARATKPKAAQNEKKQTARGHFVDVLASSRSFRFFDVSLGREFEGKLTAKMAGDLKARRIELTVGGVIYDLVLKPGKKPTLIKAQVVSLKLF